MIVISKNDANPLEVILLSHRPKLVKKHAPTWIRLTTDLDRQTCIFSPGTEDKEFRAGYVWTLEGIQEMEMFICRGVRGEFWPKDNIEDKRRDPNYPRDDDYGWGTYLNRFPSYAIKMTEPFRILYRDGTFLDGVRGDSLLFSLNHQSIWLCEKTIFEDTYLPVNVTRIEYFRDDHFVGVAKTKSGDQSFNVYQITIPICIISSDGQILSFEPSDWLFDHGDHQEVVTRIEFKENYLYVK